MQMGPSAEDGERLDATAQIAGAGFAIANPA
jgi:hypothetical protein